MTQRPEHKEPKAITRLMMAAALTAFSVLQSTGPALALDDHEVIETDIVGMPQKAQFCQIVILQNGTLGATYDARQLGSREAGGQPARVEITATNSSYRLVMEKPNGFSANPGGYFGDVSFDASISGRGNTNFGDTFAGAPVKIKRGNTLVSANVWATKLDGSFPAGFYQVSSTIRCE